MSSFAILDEQTGTCAYTNSISRRGVNHKHKYVDIMHSASELVTFTAATSVHLLHHDAFVSTLLQLVGVHDQITYV